MGDKMIYIYYGFVLSRDIAIKKKKKTNFNLPRVIFCRMFFFVLSWFLESIFVKSYYVGSFFVAGVFVVSYSDV